jgi:hypothetical protein
VTGAGVAVEISRVIAMTDARTYRAHLVTDAVAAAGRAPGGRYISVCGMELLPASLGHPGNQLLPFLRLLASAWGMAPCGEGRAVD